MDNLEIFKLLVQCDPIGIDTLEEIWNKHNPICGSSSDGEEQFFEELPMPENSKLDSLLLTVLRLPEDERKEFIKALAAVSTGEDSVLFATNVGSLEHAYFVEYFKQLYAEQVVDQVTISVLEQISNESFDHDALLKKSKESVAIQEKATAERLAELGKKLFAQKQFRKSSPVNIRRNVEICDKFASGNWSQGQLAKEYGFKSSSSIRDILGEELKWRTFVRKLDRDMSK
jgi:hypothetical protein